MDIRTVPRPVCFLCGGKGELMHPNVMDGMFGVSGNWNLKQCANKDCSLSWLDPAPHEDDLVLLYKTYFTHGLTDSRQRFLARLRSLLHSGYMAVGYIPSKCLGIRKARRQIRHMFLEDLTPGRLLDVGCGDGAFLNRMHLLGWVTTGVDFDGKAIENAKLRYGLDQTFLHSDLHGANFPDGAFDAITMSHVIEHVPDPVSLLVEVRRVLKPGGRLVVTTPNIRSYGHEKFGDCWWGLDAPRHLQIFSLPALHRCAQKAGFELIQTSASVANADTFMGGSFGFVEAKRTGNRSSGSKIKFNFIRGIRSLLLQYREAWMLRHDVSRFECGEEAILICHKK